MIDISEIKANAGSSVKPAGRESILNREIKLFSYRMTDKRKEKFYRELETLLSAGVDLRTALELLIEAGVQKEEQRIAKDILQKIESGATLPDAIQSTQHFSEYEYYMMRIGEESGRMGQILHDLANYYGKKVKQRRKVVAALTYPAIVIGVAVIAVVFMLKFVVPMFADMLSRFGTELPALTQVIITVADGLESFGLYVLLALAALIITLTAQRKREGFRKYSSSLVLRIPLIGRTTQKVYMERFCHAMHVMLGARTNLLDALELAEKMIGFYPIEQSLKVIRKEVFAGSSLHTAMSAFPVYPKRVTSLIRVAEEVNKVDEMFGKLSEQLSEEIEHETSQIGSVVEPFMILFLGVLVAVILVAMYLPMFRLGSAFG